MKRGKYKKHKENPTSFKKLPWEDYQAKYLNEFGQKQCHTCRSWFDFSTFPNNKTSPFGKLHSCRKCHNKRCRETHAEARASCPNFRRKARDYYYRRNYGLTVDEYESLLKDQESKCKICNKEVTGKQAHLDHNHVTGKIRGFLCNNCNRGIGYLQDDVDLLKSAILYLEEHNEK